MIYQLADGVEIENAVHGGVLVSSRPLRMVRLNRSLLDLVQRLPNVDLRQLAAAEVKALEKLVKGGFVDRRWHGLEDMAELPTVSIIIPVKDRAEDLRHCLNSLEQLDYPQDKLQVVVVDDGSSDETPDVAENWGAILLRSGKIGGGPAFARNKGASVAEGEILAFIDSDCSAEKNWLSDLLPVFYDEELAAVGGLVDGMHHGSALDRYEAVMSSLNLGRREMSGGPGADTFYLPSCNLLIRKKAFSEAGGFRSELHVGEDVDLTWRLRDLGWKIKYMPCGTVYHAHRSFLWPFMKRRFDYGTSEGILHQLHPVRGKKMILPPMLTFILVLLMASVLLKTPWPLPIAASLLLIDVFLTRRRLDKIGLDFSLGKIFAARLRAVGSLGYYIGYHLLRYYLLPLILSAVFLPKLAILMLLIVLGVGLVDYRVRKPKISLLGFYMYYTLEQLSYGTGVLRGCLKVKSIASYALDFKCTG
ncbi:MAG: mycofactocin biosynthesis glycosyltransferase MftF [Desulfuromonas sp.]|nr:mycofactocin biosynthesis glycosyltransferase MftF [Desulfuromonas sp.]